MKAISVLPPFAWLLALGVKRVETRPVMTAHRGPLGIHATRGVQPRFRDAVMAWMRHPTVQSALRPRFAPDGGEVTLADLPCGGLIAMTYVDTAARITGDAFRAMIASQHGPAELGFGDYRDGRTAISVTSPVLLPALVPCRGQQAPMIWDVGDAAEATVRAMLEPMNADPVARSAFSPELRHALFSRPDRLSA